MKTRRPVDLFATAEPARPQLEVTLFSEPEEEVLVLGATILDRLCRAHNYPEIAPTPPTPRNSRAGRNDGKD